MNIDIIHIIRLFNTLLLQPLNIHLNKRNHCLYYLFCPHFSVIYNLKYYEMINVYKFNAQNCVRCFGDAGISTSAPHTEEIGGQLTINKRRPP